MDDLLVNKNQEKKRIVDIQSNMINSVRNVANYVQMNEQDIVSQIKDSLNLFNRPAFIQNENLSR